MTTYNAVMLTKKGGPEVLARVTLPIVDPGPGEARVRVLACGVGYTDVIMRRGYYPFAPKIPFVPGYEIVGEVDAVGPGVTALAKGDRVAGLLVHGGYAEFVVRGAEEFILVPAELDSVDVVASILNYVTALQMIERVAKPAKGDTALVTGANGGVGQALLELLRDRGVRAIGAASERHHGVVRALGAEPIESRGATLEAGVRAIVPDGVDVAFDGLGGKYFGDALRATKKGGIAVAYGFTATMVNGSASLTGVLRTYASIYLGARMSGRRAEFYGITAIYRDDPGPFREDLPKVFRMLKEGRIRPAIAERLPLLDARRANEAIERGGVSGKIVLVA